MTSVKFFQMYHYKNITLKCCKGMEVVMLGCPLCGGLVKTTKSLSAF